MTLTQETVAYHEAAHAVARYLYGQQVGSAYSFAYVTIEPEDGASGHVKYRNLPKKAWEDLEVGEVGRWRKRVEVELVTALAGSVQDQLRGVDDPEVTIDVFGVAVYAGQSCHDVEQAVLIATVYEDGDNETAGALLNYMAAKTRALLRSEHGKAAVEAVAQELLERKRLSYAETKAIVRAAHEDQLTERVREFHRLFSDGS